MERHLTMISVSLMIALAMFLPPTVRAAEAGISPKKLRSLHDPNVPASERIAQGIAYLQQELDNPSPKGWGMRGGPIDTSYMQSVIVGVLAFPGAEDPKTLRRFRDKATNPRLKELLTVSLGLTGAQDTIPMLLHIVQHDRDGLTRNNGVRALGVLSLVPRATDVPPRVRPGEVWHPLPHETQQAIVERLIAALGDPYKAYAGPRAEEKFAVFAVQEQAATFLRLLGYDVQPTQTGWQVLTKQGQQVSNIKVERGKASIPRRRGEGPPSTR